MDRFDTLLADVRNGAGLPITDPEREGLALQAKQALAALTAPGADAVLDPLAAAVPAAPLTVPPLSQRAIDLITGFEVGSAQAYDQHYRHPVWPRGQSGITCGIGYDVGYVTPATLAADWRGHTSDGNIAALARVCGARGAAAAALLDLVTDIDIPFANAMAVFRITLGQTTSKTVRALPNAVKLSGDSLGALVSLVYNRGASFFLQGERYTEMRQIQGDIAASHFSLVPARMRSMKRLWQNDPDARGLLTRRELEATLFEAGLAHG